MRPTCLPKHSIEIQNIDSHSAVEEPGEHANILLTNIDCYTRKMDCSFQRSWIVMSALQISKACES